MTASWSVIVCLSVPTPRGPYCAQNLACYVKLSTLSRKGIPLKSAGQLVHEASRNAGEWKEGSFMELSISTRLKLAAPNVFFLVCLSQKPDPCGWMEEQRTWGEMHRHPAERGCGSQAVRKGKLASKQLHCRIVCPQLPVPWRPTTDHPPLRFPFLNHHPLPAG